MRFGLAIRPAGPAVDKRPDKRLLHLGQRYDGVGPGSRQSEEAFVESPPVWVMHGGYLAQENLTAAHISAGARPCLQMMLTGRVPE